MTVVVFNKRHLKLPYLMMLGVVVLLLINFSWLLLLSPLLIVLGFICSAPNLNLADGFLSNVAAAVLVLLGLALGSRVCFELAAIAWLAWLGCSLELAWRIETKRKGYVGEE